MSFISSLIRKQVLEENKKIGFTLSQDPGKGKVTRLHTMISKNVRTSQNFLVSDFKDHGAQPPLVTDEDTGGQRVKAPVIGKRNTSTDFG